MSLQKKILIVMIAMAFCVSLVSYISTYRLTNNVVSEFESEISTLTADHTAQMLRNYLTNVRTTLVRMVENLDVQEVADHRVLTTAQQQKYAQDLQNKTNEFVELSKYIGSSPLEFINIYLRNGVSAKTTNADIFPYSDF